MEIHNFISSENIQWLQQQLQNEQPWWVIAAVSLVPLCILLFVREMFCWFWKVNQLLTSLKRMEFYLAAQHEFLEEQRRLIAAKREREQLAGNLSKGPVAVPERRRHAG